MYADAKELGLLTISGAGPLLTATPPATIIDLAVVNFQALTFALNVGVGTTSFSATNTLAFNVQDSDDGVAFSPVTDQALSNASGTTGGNIFIVNSPIVADTLAKIGYVGGKRFLSCQPVLGGTHAGTALHWTGILSRPLVLPVRPISPLV